MAQSTIYSRVLGTGSYLPPGRVTNQDLAERLAKQGVETSDEWIVARTGIHARHFAEPDVTTSDLALIAVAARDRSGGYRSAIHRPDHRRHLHA